MALNQRVLGSSPSASTIPFIDKRNYRVMGGAAPVGVVGVCGWLHDGKCHVQHF